MLNLVFIALNTKYSKDCILNEHSQEHCIDVCYNDNIKISLTKITITNCKLMCGSKIHNGNIKISLTKLTITNCKLMCGSEIQQSKSRNWKASIHSIFINFSFLLFLCITLCYSFWVAESCILTTGRTPFEK